MGFDLCLIMLCELSKQKNGTRMLQRKTAQTLKKGKHALIVENNATPVKLNYVSTVNVDGMQSVDFLSW